MTFYEDNSLPFFLWTLNIIWLVLTCEAYSRQVSDVARVGHLGYVDGVVVGGDQEMVLREGDDPTSGISLLGIKLSFKIHEQFFSLEQKHSILKM